jgi:hypothetical protein
MRYTHPLSLDNNSIGRQALWPRMESTTVSAEVIASTSFIGSPVVVVGTTVAFAGGRGVAGEPFFVVVHGIKNWEVKEVRRFRVL